MGIIFKSSEKMEELKVQGCQYYRYLACALLMLQQRVPKGSLGFLRISYGSLRFPQGSFGISLGLPLLSLCFLMANQSFADAQVMLSWCLANAANFELLYSIFPFPRSWTKVPLVLFQEARMINKTQSNRLEVKEKFEIQIIFSCWPYRPRQIQEPLFAIFFPL